MAKAVTVEWLDAASAVTAGPTRGPFARVLVCDIHDPALGPLRTLSPDAGDLADASYPGASERSTFLERRVVLRSFAAQCAGTAPESIGVFYDEHGAPRVLGAGLYVSASSRGARTALAVASSPVGVDLEVFDDAVPVIEDVLGKTERAALASLAAPARANAFLHVWTAKEAYLKAVGRGFKRDPALIKIDVRGEAFRVEDTGFAAELSASAFAPRRDGLTGWPDLIVACAVLPPVASGTTP